MARWSTSTRDNIFCSMASCCCIQSFLMAWITKQARETAALGRELLGGNGIVTDFHAGKAFCDMDSVYSCEDSYDVNALVAAREITGISSIRPSSRL